MMRTLPPSYLALLLLAVHAEGVLAVDDVDETIAVVIFAVLILVFAVIALFFLIMIIRLKREQREVSDNRKRRQRDIVRINTQRDLVVGYKDKREPGRLRTLSEGSTNTNPSTVTNYTFNHQTSEDPLLSSTTSTLRQNSNGAFNNLLFSAQLSQTSEVTITTNTVEAVLPTVHESHDPTDGSHDPSSSPPDYYQLYKKPPSSSDVTRTVSFSSEEKEQLSASPEIEKQPLPPAEHNGSPPQIHSTTTLDHASPASENQPHPPTETLEHNGSALQVHASDHVMHNGDHVMKRETLGVDTIDQPINNITNGAAGVGVATSPNNAMDEKIREKISPGTKRKGLKRLLFGKEKPRRNSQKPLLNSQSSTATTPGDSPPQLKVSSTADLPDTFEEEDEKAEENAITMNANGMYIPPMEETSL